MASASGSISCSRFLMRCSAARRAERGPRPGSRASSWISRSISGPVTDAATLRRSERQLHAGRERQAGGQRASCAPAPSPRPWPARRYARRRGDPRESRFSSGLISDASIGDALHLALAVERTTTRPPPEAPSTSIALELGLQVLHLGLHRLGLLHHAHDVFHRLALPSDVVGVIVSPRRESRRRPSASAAPAPARCRARRRSRRRESGPARPAPADRRGCRVSSVRLSRLAPARARSARRCSDETTTIQRWPVQSDSLRPRSLASVCGAPGSSADLDAAVLEARRGARSAPARASAGRSRFSVGQRHHVVEGGKRTCRNCAVRRRRTTRLRATAPAGAAAPRGAALDEPPTAPGRRAALGRDGRLRRAAAPCARRGDAIARAGG